jgi:hypothetical protein
MIAPRLVDPRLIDAARAADIVALARRVGARLKPVRATAWKWCGPCPKCGGVDRFSINSVKRIFNCRKCGGGDTIALAQHALGLDFVGAVTFVVGEAPARPYGERRQALAPAPAAVAPDESEIAAALALWRASVEPRGTIAEKYLNTRGLALNDDVAGEAIRWHAGRGAMVALFRNVRTGEPQAISRTYLTPDGRKTERLFKGPVGGAAIQFDTAPANLTIGEGIETALTARALGLGATWATGSAGAIAAFPLVDGVRRLRILVERDPNGASERAATACAERWQASGRDIEFRLPPLGCGDLNDLVRGDRR